MITVIIPGVLRAEAGGESKLRIDDAGEAPTLGSVLDVIAHRWPQLERRVRDERGDLRRYVNVYVNGEDSRRLDGTATPVPDGAEIQLLPSVAGG